MRLVVATKNRHKLDELRAMLRGLPVEVEGVPDDWDVDEPWESFEENAAHKARAAAKALSAWALADDSGLEVDALRGAPGVRSARYAGEPKDDVRNNAKLIEAMRDVPEDRRSARFRCVLALASPDGEVRSAAGACEGTIGFAPRGRGGFGYDPLFIVAGLGGKTMAELSNEEKNRISHRARAYGGLRGLLGEIAETVS